MAGFAGRERILDEIPVVIVDTKGAIRYWSGGAEKIFGYSEDAATGRSLDLIVPEEFRQAHWNGFRQAMACGSAKSEGLGGPIPVATAEGRTVSTPGRLSLLRGLDGKVVGAMVVFG